MADTKFSTDFTTGSIPKQLLIFTAPLYASNLLQILYTVADMVIVGHVLGKVGLSAVSIGGDVANFLMFFAMGFSNAGQVIIAQLFGAGKRRDLGRFIGNMMSFLFAVAIILTFVCLFFCETILELMNTPPEALEEAFAFTTVIIGGLIFTYGYNAISAILRGLGDSRHPFIFIGAAAILNVVLDIIFVIVVGMGAMGAALATVISQGVSFIACVIFLSRNREQLGFSISKFDFLNFDKKLLSGFIKLGLPMAIKNASIYISKIFVNS
ncbi:MAG: polysaccharide biosynthesis C-terminal domain-containing protein, partial [Selenomonadaceae bacterium]|nr:polysaccharide biosynthesis C-terminal domain-containing protein [Selenomonadaceae bacterium]